MATSEKLPETRWYANRLDKSDVTLDGAFETMSGCQDEERGGGRKEHTRIIGGGEQDVGVASRDGCQEVLAGGSRVELSADRGELCETCILEGLEEACQESEVLCKDRGDGC